jgi:ATP-binding cassette subfamily B protein
MARLFRSLWPYLRPYRWAYARGFAVVLLGAAVSVAVPLLIKEAIERLEAQALPAQVIPLAGWIVGLAAARALFQFWGRTDVLCTARRVEADLRQECMRRLTRQGPDFYAQNLAGDLTSRLINDLEQVRVMAGFGLSVGLGMSVLLLLSVGVMLWLSPLLTAAAVVPLAGISVVWGLTAHRQRERSDQVQAALGRISAAAQENFAGVRVVRAYALEEAEQERMTAHADDYLRSTMALARVRGASWALLMLMTEAALGLTLWVGGTAIIDGGMGRGELIAFIYYEFMLVWPMMALGWVVTMQQRAAACMDRLRLVLEAPTRDPGVAPAEPAPAAIEVRDLTFAHQGRATPVLRGVTLRIEAGRRTALVGRVGAGKSTLVRLLGGLHPAPPGAIFIDGADLTGLPAAAIRARAAFVPQESFLFTDTLRENIAFGSRDPVGAEAVVAAARTAGLEPDVAEFREGYGTVVGERGITLSGGQRQRVCLARALIKGASTVILDDPFSSVDVRTEQAILANLEEALRGKTLLWVTHRMASLRGVDRIAVLEDGRIVEEGDFESLAAAGGRFARMLQRQAIEQELLEE